MIYTESVGDALRLLPTFRSSEVCLFVDFPLRELLRRKYLLSVGLVTR